MCVTKEQIIDIIDEAVDNIIDNSIYFTVNDYDVVIEQDLACGNPRTWDNMGKMVCFHRNYSLGDYHDYDNYYQFIHAESGLYEDEHTEFLTEEQIKECEEEFEKNNVVLPLYLYDHSGLTMRTAPFSCPWDSGQVGIIYVENDVVCKTYGVDEVTPEIRKKVVEILDAEVKIYDTYLRGDVFCYQIGKNGKHIDGCCGYYGDIEESGILDAIIDAINNFSEKEEDQKKYQKITSGYVRQVFDEKGNLVEQEFVAGDDVEWLDECNNPVADEEENLVLDFYHPFDMRQS